MKHFAVLGTAIFAAWALAAGAFARSTGAPPLTVALGPLRVTFASTIEHRSFSSCSYAVTGTHGTCVRGIVISNYPLKKFPSSRVGRVFRSNGFLFELYKAPTRRPGATRTLPPPLSLAKFRTVRTVHASGQQRELFFRAAGANYRAIVWIGTRAGKSLHDDLTSVIGGIEVQ